MSDIRDVEDMLPGDVFSHEDMAFICIRVTRGSQDVTNLHAMRLEDFEGGKNDRDYLFTCLTPLTLKVDRNLHREHIVVNIA